MGLSPHVRGNPLQYPSLDGVDGSIPARAGEPADSPEHLRTTRVYPRTCGGTISGAVSRRSTPGLSPHVRGNRPRFDGGVEVRGSIPARAGEPRCPGSGPKSHRVYPRTCGGTSTLNAGTGRIRGLSPHVRGNLMKGELARLGRGSIPARAGEPCSAVAPVSRWRVYPRTCGGTSSCGISSSRCGGLSPHVRGNHRGFPLDPWVSGSIPARAGEPEAHGDLPLLSRVYPRTCGGTP